MSFLTLRSSSQTLLITLSICASSIFHFQLIFWFFADMLFFRGPSDRYSGYINLPMPTGDWKFLRNSVFFCWCGLLGVALVPFSSLYNTNYRGGGIYGGIILTVILLLLFLSEMFVGMAAGYDAGRLLPWVPSIVCCICLIVMLVRQLLGYAGIHNASYRIYVKNLLQNKDDFTKRLEQNERKNAQVREQDEASGSHRDLGRAPYVLYGVKYIDLVSLAPCPRPAPRATRLSGSGTVRA